MRAAFGKCVVLWGGMVAAAGETKMHPTVERVEVVTANAVIGDGGNNWGGHQTRIVRTKDGVFAEVFIVSAAEANLTPIPDSVPDEARSTRRT